MNTSAILNDGVRPNRRSEPGDPFGISMMRPVITAFVRRPEMIAFALVIAVVNLPLISGQCWHSLIFQPEAVRAGQWWCLFTHPLVHVTWYHLLLDGSAFFLLYNSLLEERLTRRLEYLLAAAAGSLALTWGFSGSANGLCGLSGVAHGLMAVSALELILRQPRRSPEWRAGMITLGMILAKAGYEALTGHMFFAFLDFGLLGTPVSVSHAGGVIGALLLVLLRFHGNRRPALDNPPRNSG